MRNEIIIALPNFEDFDLERPISSSSSTIPRKTSRQFSIKVLILRKNPERKKKSIGIKSDMESR